MMPHQEDEASLDSDPDGFTFQGAFLHETYDDDDLDGLGVWLSAVNDDDDSDENPLPPPTFELVAPSSEAALAETVEPTSGLLQQATLPEPEVPVSDPYSTVAISLALATVQNEMNAFGFTAETLIQLGDAAALRESPSGNPSAPPEDHHLQCFQLLANAAHNHNPTWSSNVVSPVPGLTLYNLEDPYAHLGDIHAPVHCDFCGRLGDWQLPCRCEHGTHAMSDDSVYSSGHLGIHWDSDIDTAEFL